ncbi:Penicillin-binding protein 1A [Candidatus Hepatincolaceae symbiont of Richtersius coronifer]
MKSILKLFKEVLGVISDSFIYLVREIKYMTLACAKILLRAFNKKGKKSKSVHSFKDFSNSTIVFSKNSNKELTKRFQHKDSQENQIDNLNQNADLNKLPGAFLEIEKVNLEGNSLDSNLSKYQADDLKLPNIYRHNFNPNSVSTKSSQKNIQGEHLIDYLQTNLLDSQQNNQRKNKLLQNIQLLNNPLNNQIPDHLDPKRQNNKQSQQIYPINLAAKIQQDSFKDQAELSKDKMIGSESLERLSNILQVDRVNKKSNISSQTNEEPLSVSQTSKSTQAANASYGFKQGNLKSEKIENIKTYLDKRNNLLKQQEQQNEVAVGKKAKVKGFKEKFPKKKSTIKNKLLKVAILLFIAFSSVIVYFSWDLPDYRILAKYAPALTTRIYSADSYIISEFATEKRTFININYIPKIVKEAFISAEDKNFYTHKGFDYGGLARAMMHNFSYLLGKANSLEGASTITQQVAKNFLLSNQKTLKRKFREAVLTKKIENNYSKDHILELYLNEIYLGKGSYGVATASLNYFGKPITELTIAEAALLAALPKGPAKYDPQYNYKQAKIRRDWVISRMLDNGKINALDAQLAISENITIQERTNVKTIKTNYAAEEIRKDLIRKFNYEGLYNGGLIVKTTINYQYQDYAYETLRSGILSYDRRRGYRGPLYREDLTLEQTDSKQSEEAYYDNEGLNVQAASSKGAVVKGIPKVDKGPVNLKTMGSNKLPVWLNILNQNETANKNKFIVYPWRVGIVVNLGPTSAEIGLIDGSMVKLNLDDNKWAKPFDTTPELKDLNIILQNKDIIIVENVNNNWYLRQIPEINGAIIAMNPQTGDILAMQGGYSFLESQFNRATQALRQPGSAFKTFVYLAAIQEGYTGADQILDAPVVIDNDLTGISYRPKNSSGAGEYKGYVTLRSAIEYSRNLPTLRLGREIGLSPISALAMKLEVYDTPLDNLSEVIGSKETTLLKMVRAYAILVNGGKNITPNLVNLVQDKDGNIIYKRDNRACIACNNIPWEDQLPPELEDNRETLVDEKDAFIIVNLLQGVVQRGSGRRAKIAGYNIGGKTGTTNEVKDGWFIGFTPDLVVGVYIGADNPKTLGTNEEGSSLAVPIVANFLRNAIKGRESLPFRTPKGINMVWVDYQTGKPSNPGKEGSILEPFKDEVVLDELGNTVPQLNNKPVLIEDENDGIY